MNLLKNGLLCAAAALVVAATGAKADVLTLGGGWDSFYYGYASVFDSPPTVTPLLDNTLNPTGEWDFTLTGNAFLKITDAFFTGDWYNLTINGVDVGPTSFPTLDPVFEPNFDYAFHNSSFSSAYYYLPAGAYQVTGVALYSPYGVGVGGIELASNIPEPGAWAMMLTGFAGLGGLARRRRRSTDAVAA